MIFDSLTEKVTVGWRTVHNEELCDLYSIRNIIRMIEVISLLVFDGMSPRASISLLLPLLCECCNVCDQICVHIN